MYRMMVMTCKFEKFTLCRFHHNYQSEYSRIMVLLFTFMILYDIILIVNTAQLKTIIDRFYSIFNNPNKKFSGKVGLIFTHAYPGDDFYRPYIDLVIKQPFEMKTELEMADCLEVGGVKFIGDADNAEDALKKAYGIGLKF